MQGSTSKFGRSGIGGLKALYQTQQLQMILNFFDFFKWLRISKLEIYKALILWQIDEPH